MNQAIPMSWIELTFLILLAGSGASQAQDKAGDSLTPVAQQELKITTKALSYVPAEAVGAGIVRPRRLLTQPAAKLLPTEILSAQGRMQFGIDPMQIRTAVVIVGLPDGGQQPSVAGVLSFYQPYDSKRLESTLLQGTEAAEFAGKAYHRGTGFGQPSVYLPDDRTIVVGSTSLLEKMIAASANKPNSPLLERLQKTQLTSDVLAVVSIDALRGLIKAGMATQAENLPPDMKKYLKLVDLASSVEVHVALGGDFRLLLNASDDKSATELKLLIGDGLTQARAMLMASITSMFGENGTEVTEASRQYFQRLVNHFYELLQPEQKESQLVIAFDASNLSAIPIGMVAVQAVQVMPVIQVARQAAQQNQAGNNLKQIGLAMHNNHDAFKRLPASAIRDKEGKPLLSWRVKLLPFLEGNALYQEFHRDEPWDSEHNKKLIEKMPDVFRSPGFAKPGYTLYQVPTGKGTMFEGEEGKNFRAITDGLSKTIMVVEVNPERAVPWTKPEDYEYDAEKPMAGLAPFRPDGLLQVLAGDGSIHFLNKGIDADTLRAIFTIAGREPIDIPD